MKRKKSLIIVLWIIPFFIPALSQLFGYNISNLEKWYPYFFAVWAILGVFMLILAFIKSKNKNESIAEFVLNLFY